MASTRIVGSIVHLHECFHLRPREGRPQLPRPAGRGEAARAQVVVRSRPLVLLVVDASLGRHLIEDLGGPYVLAPSGATIRRPRERKLWRFTLAIQNDLGYISS